MFSSGTPVHSANGQQKGRTTGAFDRCSVDGCPGPTVQVHWRAARTWVCTRQLEPFRDGWRRLAEHPPVKPEARSAEWRIFEYLRDHLQLTVLTGPVSEDSVTVNLVLADPLGRKLVLSSNSVRRS